MSFSTNILDHSHDINTDKALNYFWFGFIIYMGSYAITKTTTINFIFCQVIQILGLIFIVMASFKLIRWEFENNYLEVVYFIYCSWLIFAIFRGFTFEYDNLKFMLFDADEGLFPYLVPVILLFPKNLKYYKKIFTVIVVLGILFLVYSTIFHDNLLDLNYENNGTKFTFEYFTKILSLPCAFLIITYTYHSNRKILFSLLVIFITVAFSIIRARRALIFMSLSPLIVAFSLYFYLSKWKILILFFSLFIGLILLYIGLEVFNENKNGVFNLLKERIDEDTRSGVIDCFYEDMDTKDWIIGRGIKGQYFCPNIDVNDSTGYRSMIEADYLTIMLKGGIISLGLLILIAVPAIVKGLFYSRNLLSKASGFWILLWLINLYPATVYTFSLNHLLVWMSVGICYSKKIRNMSDMDILKTLYTEKKLNNRILFNNNL